MTTQKHDRVRLGTVRHYVFLMVFFLVSTVGIVTFCTAERADKGDRDGRGDRMDVRVPMIPADFSGLAENVSPAVVNISTEKTVNGGGRVYKHFSQNPFGKNDDSMNDLLERFFGNQPQKEFKQRSLGSGFIIDKAGYIVTNNHVVENTDQIKVILKDDKEYEAKIIGTDKNTDLALIKIEADEKLTALDMGDSDTLKVGQWVVAIGNPFGLGHTVTAGIVSAKGRVIGSGPYDDFIQTDTSINPGNSGGPLIDLQGRVVGINTAIIQNGQGIGFAIPSNMARGIIKQLKEHGNVTRGWLGVSIQPITDEIAAYYGLKSKKGALVMEVFPGDPADKAGIKAKDIIVAVDGKDVDDSRDLTAIVADIDVNRKVKVKLLRDGKEVFVDVKVAKRDDKDLAAGGGKVDKGLDLGLTLTEITPEIQKRYNMKSMQGLLVTQIAPGSKAAKAGINPGDLIDEVNRKPVRTVAEFEAIVTGLKKGSTITMAIISPKTGFRIVKMER
ncbi:MAG: DegQ family serine endoprotease [Desulfobacteraceae bacterium]